MKELPKLSLLLVLSLIGFASARPPQELKFPPLKFVPPQIEKTALSNGITLYLLPDHELPIVNLSATIRTGAMYEPPDKIGLASLCGTLLRSGGTQSQKAEELDERLEFLGASVETGMDVESGHASLSVLTKDLDEVLALFAEILMRPAFDNKKLEIEKSKMIESVRRRNDEPYQIARREFRKLVYGDRHPLSRTAEIPLVKKISRKDLIGFYKKYYCPNNMQVAVSGDFDPPKMVQKLETLFKDWKKSEVEFPAVPSIKTPHPYDLAFDPARKKTVGYAEKTVNQASIILGHLGIKRHNPDRFVLEVMNEILGGSSFTSRLYKEVRSRQGLAYWVGSNFYEPWDYGIIAAGCQTKSETLGQTIQTILKEIEKMRDQKVSEEELKVAKDSIINSFIFRYASSHSIVTQKISLDYFGFSPDYLDNYTQKISAVTSEDVLKAARKYLRPDQLTLMVVGNQKDFETPLTQLGAVKPVDLQIPE